MTKPASNDPSVTLTRFFFMTWVGIPRDLSLSMCTIIYTYAYSLVHSLDACAATGLLRGTSCMSNAHQASAVTGAGAGDGESSAGTAAEEADWSGPS